MYFSIINCTKVRNYFYMNFYLGFFFIFYYFARTIFVKATFFFCKKRHILFLIALRLFSHRAETIVSSRWDFCLIALRQKEGLGKHQVSHSSMRSSMGKPLRMSDDDCLPVYCSGNTIIKFRVEK